METPREDLKKREREILHAVVHHYITTAEPAGSRTLVKRFQFDVSPATVRNVMADLEDRGYIQQIHTSSGRVPTDAGYRYYVDHLMHVQDLTMAERGRIERELSEKLSDADDVLRQTSHLLALVTHQTGIAEPPREQDVRVRRIELLPIASERLAVLIVDNYGRVHSLSLEVQRPVGTTDLIALNRFLNDQLGAVPLGKLASTLEERMRDFLDEQRRMADQAIKLLQHLPQHRRAQLFLEGAAQLFEQPEFSNVTKAREVLGLLEERERLVELLRAVQNGEREGRRAQVIIGGEGNVLGLEGISLIATPYQIGDSPIGMIGVLGPRRMPYPRLTAIVDYTAGMVGRMLTRLSR